MLKFDRYRRQSWGQGAARHDLLQPDAWCADDEGQLQFSRLSAQISRRWLPRLYARHRRLTRKTFSEFREVTLDLMEFSPSPMSYPKTERFSGEFGRRARDEVLLKVA
jgi:hypothetical protein